MDQLETFEHDLRRAKWLDDETLNLGLLTRPELGLSKAEVIVTLCSMLHGPLSKINTHSYASTKSIIQIITGPQHNHFVVHAGIFSFDLHM